MFKEAVTFLSVVVVFANALILNGIIDPECSISLVESIPQGLTYAAGSPTHPSTFSAWNTLLAVAKTNISVSAFYWTLLGKDVKQDPSAKPGESILKLMKLLAGRLSFRVAQSGPKRHINDLDELVSAGATVDYVDVDRLLGTGIIHTKLWTVDGMHGYVGSANMDWRSLTQVKELGVLIQHCPEIINDLDKVFGVYHLVSGPSAVIPSSFPARLHTRFNSSNPMKLDDDHEVYFTMSPPPFTPPGRNDDLAAILQIIQNAKKFVFISVMDYAPQIVFYGKKKNLFWPVIDDALRQAAIDRGVEVRLLISKWRYTPPSQRNFLKSLKVLDGLKDTDLRIRHFIVPAYTKFQKMLDHARVNHAKYMVTDNTAYVGTSNWSGDYFMYTGGVGFVSHNKNDSAKNSIRRQLEDIFLRDWDSEYAHEL